MLEKLQEKNIEELIKIQNQIANLIIEKQKEKKKELKKQFEKMADEAGLNIEEILNLKSETKKAKIKYKKGQNTWSGRGRRPAWVTELEEHEVLEDFLVK